MGCDMSTVAEMVRQVARDRWRASCPFSDSIARTAGQLLGADASERQRLLADWLAKEQTCLFGRIAAKTDRIEYCLLDEADLLGPDSAIREKIQAARLQWTKRAFRGERSALILAAISEGILFAEPSSLLQAIALP